MKVETLRIWIEHWPADAEVKLAKDFSDENPRDLVGCCSWPSGDYRTNDIKEITIW